MLHQENIYVNDKTLGIIVLCVAGLLVTIGAVGSQLAFAAIAGPYLTGKAGTLPQGPEYMGIHWAVIVAAITMDIVGVALVCRRGK